MVRYYLPGVNVETLTEEELVSLWGNLQYIRQDELTQSPKAQFGGR